MFSWAILVLDVGTMEAPLSPLGVVLAGTPPCGHDAPWLSSGATLSCLWFRTTFPGLSGCRESPTLQPRGLGAAPAAGRPLGASGTLRVPAPGAGPLHPLCSCVLPTGTVGAGEGAPTLGRVVRRCPPCFLSVSLLLLSVPRGDFLGDVRRTSYPGAQAWHRSTSRPALSPSRGRRSDREACPPRPRVSPVRPRTYSPRCDRSPC